MSKIKMKDTVDNPFKNADMIKHKSSGRSSSNLKISGKLKSIVLEAIPVLIMIAFIPIIADDYKLALLYLAVIIVSLLIKYEKKDILILISGAIIMFVFEFIFISTKVEIFQRNTLLGMPIWLPLIWAYGFIAIKRTTRILEE